MSLDHHPFLLESDLRTAEDVAKWLRRPMLDRLAEEDSSRLPKAMLTDADLLMARLDRERRQACRRGARDHWEAYSRAKNWLRQDYKKHKGEAKFGTFRNCLRTFGIANACGNHIRRALAYRAAARAT